MVKYQAGTLVVYGNLGVHVIETVGPQSFCGEPAKVYYTLRPYFSDSHDRSYIPTAKEGVLRPVSSAKQITAGLEKIKVEELPVPAANNQTRLAEHFIPGLFGSLISTVLIALSLFSFEWRMALAALWVIPVSAAIVVGSYRVQDKVQARTMAAKMACADGIQEYIETSGT